MGLRRIRILGTELFRERGRFAASLSDAPHIRRESNQPRCRRNLAIRSEEHTSELQSLMRISYAVFCLKKKNRHKKTQLIIKQQKTETQQRIHIQYTKHIPNS